MPTLWQHRELLLAWTIRTVRARYQQSLLGGLWAILQPAAQVAIFSIIFTRFIPVDTDDVPYILFSYTAMVPWTLFTTSTNDMVNALTDNMSLVQKIYFPREILPLSALLARLVDYGIAMVVLVIVMVAYGWVFFPAGWLLLPFILLIQLSLTIGLGLAGAAINVFYRDVKHLVVLGLQLWLYASPVIYPITLVPERWRTLYFLNPMAGALEAYRAIILYETLPGTYLITSAITSFLILLIGYILFKRVEFQFADVV